MESSGSCLRCARPLAADSVGGLCPTCASAGDTPLSVPAPPSAGPATAPYHPAVVTASFNPAGGGDRETATLEPAALVTPASPGTLPPRSGLPEPPTGYRLIRRLGGGGMGDVFLALDTTADRLVALKYLRAATNPTALDRFFREVQALARADHPNIIRVLGHNFYWSVPYFTMEYVAGGTLGGWLSRHGPADPAEAARVMATVARAVHAAHEAKVLHRDLKPGNILLRGEDTGFEAPTEVVGAATPAPATPLSALTPLVSDFGLAKRTDDADSLTPTTGAIGTPGYMPPEQVSRRFGEIGRHSDVYGLGATLYHLLTGRPPFTGPEPEVFDRILNTPPDRPRAVRPEVPPGLDAVVMKCLEKRPADRFASAAELAGELEKCAAGELPVTPPLTCRRRAWRWAKRNKARLSGAGLALLAVGGLVALTAPTPKRNPVDEIRKELAAGRAVTLIGETGLPRWHDWRLVPSTLTASPTTERCATFQAPYFSILELLPDPMTSRYRVTAEIRQLFGQPLDPTGRTTMSFVGLCFGSAPQELDSGVRAQPVFTVQFTDVLQEDPAGQDLPAEVALCATVYVQSPDALPRFGGVWKRGVVFSPGPRWPGKWRRVVVEVTPDRLTAKWDDEPGRPERLIHELSGEQARSIFAGMDQQIRRMAPRSIPAAPAWHPRLSLGVIAYQATVSVRNVSVEPLP